jgi:hypothetical protein
MVTSCNCQSARIYLKFVNNFQQMTQRILIISRYSSLWFARLNPSYSEEVVANIQNFYSTWSVFVGGFFPGSLVRPNRLVRDFLCVSYASDCWKLAEVHPV